MSNQRDMRTTGIKAIARTVLAAVAACLAYFTAKDAFDARNRSRSARPRR
jgi:hypothetical protein